MNPAPLELHLNQGPSGLPMEPLPVEPLRGGSLFLKSSTQQSGRGNNLSSEAHKPDELLSLHEKENLIEDKA